MAGRKPLSLHEQVDRLPGSPAAKQRLRVLLANLAGQIGPRAACAALGVQESRFFELKHRSLEQWVETLEPGTPGRRPAAAPSAAATRIAALEQEKAQLELELKTALVRAELAEAGLSQPRPRPARRGAAKKARR